LAKNWCHLLLAFAAFCGPAGVRLKPLVLAVSYQLPNTNLPVGTQLDDDDDVQ